MLYPALVSILALILYQVFTLNVARARGKYGVRAPHMTGSPEFERRLRVQQNTLEQLIVFLPSLWLFGIFWAKPSFAAIVGVFWIVGRIMYACTYYKDAEKRYPGMIITLLANAILSVGALIGIALKLLAIYNIHF